MKAIINNEYDIDILYEQRLRGLGMLFVHTLEPEVEIDESIMDDSDYAYIGKLWADTIDVPE